MDEERKPKYDPYTGELLENQEEQSQNDYFVDESLKKQENRSDTYFYEYEDKNKKRGADSFSKVSMILGIIALVATCSCCCSVVGVPLAIASLIFGILAKDEYGKKDSKAITGIVTSVISIVLFVLFLMATVFYMPEAYTEMQKYGNEIQNGLTIDENGNIEFHSGESDHDVEFH